MQLAGVLLGASKRFHRVPSTGGNGIGPAPSAPTQLEVTGGAGQATVSWTAPVYNADGSDVATPGILHYLVYWGTTPGQQHAGGSHAGGASPATVSAGTLSATITSLAAGTWWFGVSPVNANGEGSSSPEASGVVT